MSERINLIKNTCFSSENPFSILEDPIKGELTSFEAQVDYAKQCEANKQLQLQIKLREAKEKLNKDLTLDNLRNELASV